MCEVEVCVNQEPRRVFVHDFSFLFSFLFVLSSRPTLWCKVYVCHRCPPLFCVVVVCTFVRLYGDLEKKYNRHLVFFVVRRK